MKTVRELTDKDVFVNTCSESMPIPIPQTELFLNTSPVRLLGTGFTQLSAMVGIRAQSKRLGPRVRAVRELETVWWPRNVQAVPSRSSDSDRKAEERAERCVRCDVQRGGGGYFSPDGQGTPL